MPTIGELGNAIYTCRARKDDINAQLKEVNGEIDTLEFQLIQMMDEQEIDKASCDHGSLTKKIELFPQIVDKEAFVAFAVQAGDISMLQLQANRAAFKAYYEANNEYPDGLDAYEKKTINYRRAK